MPHSSRTPRSQGSDPRQLSLFDRAESTPDFEPQFVPETPDSREKTLFRSLARLLHRPLAKIELTDNRTTILTAAPEARGSAALKLRLHRSFLWAPHEVLQAISQFVKSGKRSERGRSALALIREHFTQHPTAKPRERRRTILRPLGECFDLIEIRDAINTEFFGGKLTAAITWGRGAVARRPRRRRTSTIQLGTYSYEDNLIRIHPALDQAGVPRYVVESVVHHELLHAALPPLPSHGRRCYHTPEFRRRERLYPDLARAEKWIAEKLPELLYGQPTTKPSPRPRGGHARTKEAARAAMRR